MPSTLTKFHRKLQLHHGTALSNLGEVLPMKAQGRAAGTITSEKTRRLEDGRNLK
jgi:hypothetical protein